MTGETDPLDRVLLAIAETERTAQLADPIRYQEHRLWLTNHREAVKWMSPAEQDHVARQSPRAVIHRCQSDREVITDYRAAVELYNRDPDAFQAGAVSGLWVAVKRIAAAYGIEVDT